MKLTKKQFLKELEAKLSKMTISKKKIILNKYSKIIDKEIDNGKTEKQAVADCGNIDLIVKLISDDKEELVESKISLVINNILDFINDIFKKIDEKTAKTILSTIVFIFIALIGLWILYIPFKIVEVIIIGLFRLIFNHYIIFNLISGIWSLIINLSFLAIAVWITIYYISQIKNKYENK